MSLSPMHGVNAVDSSWDNPPILRQYWPAARCLKNGQTIAVGNGLEIAAGNILDIKTVFIFAASSPVLAPLPMHPVLHSSCSTPVPYAPGLTALEIDTSVRAGFPSPAEDFQAERIDVLKHIIVHPQATFTLRVRGVRGDLEAALECVLWGAGGQRERVLQLAASAAGGSR